jgi:hypothetical protein
MQDMVESTMWVEMKQRTEVDEAESYWKIKLYKTL